MNKCNSQLQHNCNFVICIAILVFDCPVVPRLVEPPVEKIQAQHTTRFFVLSLQSVVSSFLVCKDYDCCYNFNTNSI